MKSNTFIKLITSITLAAFISQSAAIAIPTTSSPITPQIESAAVLIPEHYGTLEKPPADLIDLASQRVFLIKDAHCNFEAQTNIARILDLLIRSYQVDLVGVEGAAGEVTPQILLQADPAKEIVAEITEKYLHSGLLTGSEFLSANRGKDPGFTLWGVEDLRLYLQDYQSFRQTITANQHGLRFLTLTDTIIVKLKQKLYSAKLREFDTLYTNYRTNQVPLTEFISTLNADQEIPAGYPALKLVLESIGLEEKIDFKEVERQRTGLIGELERLLPRQELRRLIASSLAYKTGKIPALDYYTFLHEKAADCFDQITGDYNDLAQYIKLVKLQARIDGAALFQELDTYVETLYDKLCTDKITANLHRTDKAAFILAKLLTLQAAREDIAYYQNHRQDFQPETLLQFLTIQARANAITCPRKLTDPEFLAKVTSTLDPAEEFYHYALQRDTALIDNLLALMEENNRNQAALICGGFHSEGIKHILNERGIAVYTISPAITKMQENAHELYLAQMMDQRVNPEKMLLDYDLSTLSPILPTGQQGISTGRIDVILDAIEQRLQAMRGEDFTIRRDLSPPQLSEVINNYYEWALAEGNEVLARYLEQAVRNLNTELPAENQIKLATAQERAPPAAEAETAATAAEAETAETTDDTGSTALKAPGSSAMDDEEQGIDHDYFDPLLQDAETVAAAEAQPILRVAIGLINERGPPTPGLTPDNVIIRTVTPEEDPTLLGIPRKSGATRPQDLIYAHGVEKTDEFGERKLHIYVTTAFWERLKEGQAKEKSDLRLMLAFLTDHEWHERILGKSHAETSKRAWLFTDQYGMNPFYRFYIDQLAEVENIEDLRALIEPHPNDPQGIFRSYVIKKLTIDMPHQLQKEVNIALYGEGENKEGKDKEKALRLLAKLEALHQVIDDLSTDSGRVSALVLEKLLNIMFDILKHPGDRQVKVNLMCITPPMGLTNKIDYTVTDMVSYNFYQKVMAYLKEKGKRVKGREVEEHGLRAAYNEVAGKYYAFSRTRLLVIGLEKAEFEEIKELYRASFEEAILPEDKLKTLGFTSSKQFIDFAADQLFYAGHTTVSLAKNPRFLKEIVSYYELAEIYKSRAQTAREEGQTRMANSLAVLCTFYYKKISTAMEDLIVDAVRDATAKAELAEKVFQRGVLGEEASTNELYAELDTGTREMLQRAIAAKKSHQGEEIDAADIGITDIREELMQAGRLKAIPDSEFDTGFFPRFGHNKGNLERLIKALRAEVEKGDADEEQIREKHKAYATTMNTYMLRSLQDTRFHGAFKKSCIGSVLMATQDETLQNYLAWLNQQNSEHWGEDAEIAAIIDPKVPQGWNCPLKMTKMGDEIWLYFRTTDRRTVRHGFPEIDKFNAFNEMYPADTKDSIYHQILQAVYDYHREFNEGGNFTEEQIKNFLAGLEERLMDTEIEIPADEVYDQGFTPFSKAERIKYTDVWGNETTYDIDTRPVLEKEKYPDQTLRTGMKVPLGDLRCHYTEKLKGKRLPAFEVIGPAGREVQYQRIVVYNHRIYTEDGKEDVTEKVMDLINQENWQIKPHLAPIGFTVTTDNSSLTNLAPDIISNINTLQKAIRKLHPEPLDTREIVAYEILTILKKFGLDVDTGKNFLTDPTYEIILTAITEAHEKGIQTTFKEVWSKIKDLNINETQFFELAAAVSKPLQRLLGPTTMIRSSNLMNTILLALLEEFPTLGEKEEVTGEKLSPEKKLIEALKIQAAQQGISADTLEGLFNLFRQGLEMLSLDPDLDIGEIDASYFTVVAELARIIGDSKGKIIAAFQAEFGEKFAADKSKGKLIEGSLLWKEAAKLREYRKDEFDRSDLSELKEGERKGLWDSDFTQGEDNEDTYTANLQTQPGETNRTSYLSGLDAVSKDTRATIAKLRGTPAEKTLRPDTKAAVIYHIEDFITLERPTAEGQPWTFTYRPGLEAVLTKLGENTKIVFVIPAGVTVDQKAEYIKALKATGRYRRSVFQQDSMEDALTMLTETLPADEKIAAKNVAYAAPSEQPAEQAKRLGIQKIVNFKEGSAFHASLLFAVLYARTKDQPLINGRINPEVNSLIWRFLGTMEKTDDEINEVINNLLTTGFFSVTFIRIKDTLKAFQNSRLYISTAA